MVLNPPDDTVITRHPLADAIVRVARLRPTKAIPLLNLGEPACATMHVGSRALNEFLAVRGGAARVLGPVR